MPSCTKTVAVPKKKKHDNKWVFVGVFYPEADRNAIIQHDVTAKIKALTIGRRVWRRGASLCVTTTSVA